MSRPRNDQSRWIVLAIIDLFIEKNACSPTVRDICDLTGIKAESHVWKLLQELIHNGYVTCLNKKARTIQITPAGKLFLHSLREQGTPCLIACRFPSRRRPAQAGETAAVKNRQLHQPGGQYLSHQPGQDG